MPPATESATEQIWRVICLCAQWCGVCRDYQSLFDRVALEHPDVQFDWVDVEDEAEAMGDVDVETFPTLLVAQGGNARFLGPVPPAAEQLARLLSGLRRDSAANAPQPPGAGALLQRLLAARCPTRVVLPS